MLETHRVCPSHIYLEIKSKKKKSQEEGISQKGILVMFQLYISRSINLTIGAKEYGFLLESTKVILRC